MIKKFQKYLSESLLIKGSLLVLVGATLSNFGSYLFHLFMGRLLGPIDYGVLESLLSLTYFLGIPIGVFNTVVTKFVSQESQNKEKSARFIEESLKKVTVWGGVGLLLFLASFPWLRNLVRVDSFLFFVGIGLWSFFGLYQTLLSGSLQGRMEFFILSLTGVISSWSKLIMAVVLVILGFRVGGAVMGLIISVVVTTLFSYYFLAQKLPLNIFQKSSGLRCFPKIGNYSLAVLVSHLSLTSLYTVDIILARFFLTPVEAGQYAALSILGKIIYFASSPILSVMFPIVSSRYAEGKDYKRVLGFSFLIVIFFSLGISSIYFLFPELMISLLFGEKYLLMASHLGPFAIFLSLFSLCSLFLNFYLSTSQTKVVFLPAMAALSQIVLINFFHQNIGKIISMNIISASFLLAGMLIYFLKTNYGQKNTPLGHRACL